jgi:hypothetical protein
MIGPVVLGSGTPAFAAGEVPPVKLIDTQTAEGFDNLLIRYAATRR